jgi:L-ascorbate metabolism protein UlaG (beta-lactamase superfamily)/pimeloyl-ACP methyl ester carboxylesterase
MQRSLALGLVLATQIACQRTNPSRPLTPNVVEASGGDITITPFMHASVQIEHAGTVIQVDPAMGDITTARPADLVLVTDIHDDHMNPSRIGKVRKPGTPVVMPAAVRDQAGKRIPAPVEVLANGETRTVAGIAIEAVPMYNLKSEIAGGEPFHAKGRGNGYVITVGGKRLYFAGDTECVPEIKALKNIDAAFLPMNLPFTMSPSEAAECVKAFKPRIVFPYHYQGQKPEEFAVALKGSGVDVRLLDWYPDVPRDDVIAVARPGALVDIGGRKIHVNCTGSGSPTVVLVAGEESFAIDWFLVQPDVAKTTRVCSYDRAGTGWSDPGGHPETAEAVVSDLHAALRMAGEKPPYVLVGHSIGGIYVRLYQLRHRDEVAGLVLVASLHEEGWAAMVDGKRLPMWSVTAAQLRATLPTERPKEAPPLPPPSTDQPYDRFPPDLLKTRVTFETRLFKSMIANEPAQMAEIVEGTRVTMVELHQASANGARPLGHRPLVVLTAENGRDPRFTALEAKLTRLSANSSQRIVAGSGSEIHLFEPGAVIRATQDVVSAVRSGAPLRNATSR